MYDLSLILTLLNSSVKAPFPEKVALEELGVVVAYTTTLP